MDNELVLDAEELAQLEEEAEKRDFIRYAKAHADAFQIILNGLR